MTETQLTGPGQAVNEVQVIEDFFGFTESKRWYFPGQTVQYIEHQVMNEGQRAQFQNDTNRDITLEKNSGNARLKLTPGKERHALLKAAVVGWHVFRKNHANGEMEPVPFDANKRNFDGWLATANPKHVDELEKEIRKANPWLLGEMSVEDIDREIENLHEMREIAQAREAAK